MFQDRHISAYLADPIALKVGYKEAKKAMFELRRLRTLELGELKAQKFIVKYEAESLENETVASIKAGFISEMLKACGTSVAFKDKNYTKPTTASIRYWKYFNYKSLPLSSGEVNVDDLCFYSPPGSLGYFSLGVNSKTVLTNPILFTESLLKAFWSRLNISFSLTPRKKVEAILKKIDFDLDYLTQAETQAKLMLKLGNFVFKREVITEESINNLPLKLLLGELNDHIVSELDALNYYLKTNSNHGTDFKLFNYKDKPITTILTKLVQLAPPAGFLFVLQALVVESYYKISKLLSTLDDTLIKNEFLSSPEYKELRFEIANSLSLVVDALTGLNLFNSVEYAGTTKNKIINLLLYFLSTTDSKTIEAGTSNRLTLFEKPISISNHNDLILAAGNSFNIKLQAPVSKKEGNLLVLSADSYIIWGQLNLTIKYLTGAKNIKAINIWVFPLSEDVTFKAFKTTLLTNQAKQITIPISGLGYGGVIAVTSNSDSEPSLDDLSIFFDKSNTLAFENNLIDS